MQIDNSLLLVVVIMLSLIVIAMSAMLVFGYRKRQYSADPDTINCHEDTFKLLPTPVVVLNDQQVIVYMNPAAEKLLECRLRSVMGREHTQVFSLLHEKTGRKLQNLFDFDSGISDKSRSHNCTLRNFAKKTYPVKLDHIVMMVPQNEANDRFYSLLVFNNLTQYRALESQLDNLEKYDSVTRLFNRKTFENTLKHIIDNAHKNDSTNVVCFLSIDQFHAVIENGVHVSADHLVSNIANLLKARISETTDIAARVGINEFGIIFRDKKVPHVVRTLEAILRDVEKHQFSKIAQQLPVTLSAGFAIIDQNTQGAQRVLSEAHMAGNLASKHGGNRVQAFTHENAEIQKLEGNLEWVVMLKKALQEDQFRMFAQPIHPLGAEAFKSPYHHYELLIRLFNEDGDQIPPDEFIPAAEYYSMMPQLDRWVVRHVLKQISKIPDQSPLPVFAINLSGQSLNDSRFLDFVLKEIKYTGVDPQMLCFEITEQVAVDDLTLVKNFISTLRNLGSSFSLDDFGTGVSSYGYLKSLSVDYLKIDGSFVKNIVTDEVSSAMVRSINQVGHTMNLKIIAEYVENDTIISILREIGVDYGQGYGIDRPGPMEEVVSRHIQAGEDQQHPKLAGL